MIDEWEMCPMGTLKNNIINCYYFGKMKIKDCNECKYKKSYNVSDFQPDGHKT